MPIWQSVHHIDRGAYGPGLTGEFLQDKLSVMDDELEIQAIDRPAGLAGAGCIADHRSLLVSERRVGRFDQLRDQFAAAEALGEPIHEDRITFYLAERHGRRQVFEQTAKDLLQDGLGVIEFRVRDE
jgi:hypothetical protein